MNKVTENAISASFLSQTLSSRFSIAAQYQNGNYFPCMLWPFSVKTAACVPGLLLGSSACIKGCVCLRSSQYQTLHRIRRVLTRKGKKSLKKKKSLWSKMGLSKAVFVCLLLTTTTISNCSAGSLATQYATLETRLSDLESEVEELKNKVRLNTFLLAACFGFRLKKLVQQVLQYSIFNFYRNILLSR